MPKFGWKCFLGSFMLSLVAVFAATKAYFVISAAEKTPVQDYELPAADIELFAASEENDPLYDKFQSLNKEEAPAAEEKSELQDLHTASAENTSDEILYQPEEDEEGSFAESEPAAQSEETKLAKTGVQPAAAPAVTASVPSPAKETAENDKDSDELQIADASTAPVFRIPLVHNYKTDDGAVFSESADENSIAMTSAGSEISNLGTDDVAAAVTDPLPQNKSFVSNSNFSAGLPQEQNDEPWEVAETANKHAGKNTYAAKHKADVASPDVKVAQSEPEQYKMQDNILIPIPESIKKERNLTPQFSSSEENLKLERELRAKHELPPLPEDQEFGKEDKSASESAAASENKTDSDETPAEEETSKSLTESIAEWFSGSKKKTEDDNVTAPGMQKNGSSANTSDGQQQSSIFNKLLGLGKGGEDIIPSELKLSFQPDRAEISGQTLEWLHAFSDNSVKNDDVFVEIRIDKSAPYALQEKRLKLLYKILTGNGVDYHKINIIFTDREPNSFIIRNIKYASEEEKIRAMKRADNPWY